MNCPSCHAPGAYVSFSSIECRSTLCAHFCYELTKVCPVCQNAADCPGWDQSTMLHYAKAEPVIIADIPMDCSLSLKDNTWYFEPAVQKWWAWSHVGCALQSLDTQCPGIFRQAKIMEHTPRSLLEAMLRRGEIHE